MVKISKDPRPAMWNAGRSPHPILIWAVGLTGVGLAALVSTFMQGALDSPMFPWFPAGVAAGFVLRFGPRLAGLGGVALAAAFLLSTPAGSPDLGWILLLASSHAIGLVLLPFALGASGRRVCVGRIRPADAARLLVFGIPTVVLPTGLILWWWPPGSALESAARIDLPASLTLGLLATLPITVTLLPDATGRRTYRCHADRLVKVIPGLALLLATTAVSWWLPTSPGGDLVHLLFAVAVLASLTWVAAHSGWFASSTALLMVCFSDPTPTFGDVLMLCPVLVFGIVIAATMEQRFRHAAKIKDRHLEIDALLQATGAAVIRLDRDGRILFGNSQAQDLLAQLDSGLAADDHFSVAFDGRSRRLVRAAFNVVMMGKRRECEVSVKRDDGPRSLHLAVFTPLHDATFEICGCSVVLLDLATSRRRALLRQRRQEREFKSLAHALVHDVNNLAMAVGGAASLVRTDDVDSVSRILAGIEDTCIEAAQRTERIRQIMPQGEQGRLVDLGRIASERLRRHARRGRITIAAMSSEAGTVVDLPESFAEFIVDEFVNNAVDAVPTTTPEIALTCRRISDGNVTFRIGDNGPGIPPAIQERIGNDFVTTKGGGRGLGLRAIATGVRAAGGRLRVTSDRMGTVIQLSLPLATPNRQSEMLMISEPRRRTSMGA